MHPPFPESSRKTDDLYIMVAVFLISFCPGSMGASKKWFNNKDFQVLSFIINNLAFSRINEDYLFIVLDMNFIIIRKLKK